MRTPRGGKITRSPIVELEKQYPPRKRRQPAGPITHTLTIAVLYPLLDQAGISGSDLNRLEDGIAACFGSEKTDIRDQFGNKRLHTCSVIPFDLGVGIILSKEKVIEILQARCRKHARLISAVREAPAYFLVGADNLEV